MGRTKEREQHIAVFGGSGSGKTVLVSSFYGHMQEPEVLRSSLFDVTADDPGQGHRLHANYLGMRDSARRPEPTRFAATPYAFSVRLRGTSGEATGRAPFDVLRLVWHDYPGEWFEQDVSGPEEAQRRLSTFRSLLGSDVALLLVDGQRLLDNAGEEERYLKSVLSSFRTGLRRLGDQLVADGKLARFPRIWILALSKSDLLPDLDVFGFRDLVIGKAAADLAELRTVIEDVVESPEALALGEDFLLLSSARFEPETIDVTERVGIDLILPLAAVLPFERYLRWIEQKRAAGKVVGVLIESAGPLAALLGKVKVRGPRAAMVRRVGSVLAAVSAVGATRLHRATSDADDTRQDMRQVLARFARDLDDAEARRVLLRSRR